MTFATTHLPTNSFPIPFNTYQRITRSATISHQINKLGSTFRYSCLYCGAALVEPRSFPISLYRVSDRANFYFYPLYLYSLCDTRSWEPWPSNAGLLNVFCWLWICGGREEHTVISVSKNRCQLKTWGWGAVAICIGSDPALLLLLLSIIATAANKTLLYSVGRPCLLRLSLSVRLWGVCFAWVNLCTYWNSPPAVALSPCPYYFWFSMDFLFFILYFFFYNRATINAQRIHAGYLRLLACVICPRGRGFIVGRVICVWYLGRDE